MKYWSTFHCSLFLYVNQLQISSIFSINTHPIGEHHLSHSAKYDPHFDIHPSFYRKIRRLKRTTNADIEVTSTPYDYFVAHNETMTCSADEHLSMTVEQVRGVNLGSWFVLEPWITPSLFYQFIGKDEGNTAFDHYSFCEVLGPEEGNKQLRNHWETWVTRDIIHELAEQDGINSVRVPVGDFMFEPYGPYIGCTDGALDYLEQLFEWCDEVNISVLIDVHVQKGSQNGFDNSGISLNMEWTSKFSHWPEGITQTFLHWPIREAGWMGKFNRTILGYPEINYDNIAHSLRVIQKIVDLYKDVPALYGVEPVNEPWEFTPMEELKKFYWEGYLIVKQSAPSWTFVMHDSFRFDPKIWGGFMDGCPSRILDTHIYQAWKTPSSRTSFYDNACAQKMAIAEMERAFGPVVVGEWSLATDNCAMWLNGFNDNLPGMPYLPCKMIPCTNGFVKGGPPGGSIDKRFPYRGPYGTGSSGPIFGTCPVGRDWSKEHTGNVTTGQDWMYAPSKASPAMDATDNVMTNLARRKIAAFSGVGHGFYFWNFRTELDEPEWSYMLALEKKWIPKGTFNTQAIKQACHREENGGYVCSANRDAEEKYIRGVLTWVLDSQGMDASYLDNLHGEDLYKEADIYYYAYWKKNSMKGATCDFGGTAYLERRNELDNDDEFDDDWTDDSVMIVKGYTGIHVILITIFGSLLGAFLGFTIAMKTSKRFNVAVRKSIFKSVKNNKMFVGRKSLFGAEGMPMLDDDGDEYESVDNK